MLSSTVHVQGCSPPQTKPLNCLQGFKISTSALGRITVLTDFFVFVESFCEEEHYLLNDGSNTAVTYDQIPMEEVALSIQ